MFLGTKLVVDDIKLYETFGILVVSSGSGWRTSPTGINQEVVEESVSFGDIPIFQGVNRTPLQFSLRFSKEGEWDIDLRRKFCDLIFRKEYYEMYSEDYPYIYYNVIPVGEAQRQVMTVDQSSIFEITFKCDAPYGWSRDGLDHFVINSPNEYTKIYLENRSNVCEYVYPSIEIFNKDEDAEFSIRNMSDNNRGFTISNLEADEKVSINNEFSVVETSVPNINRYNNFEGKWFRLRKGRNLVEVKGNVEMNVIGRYGVAL